MKKRIFLNKSLLLAGVFYVLLCELLCFVAIFYCWNYNTKNSESEKIQICVTFLVIALAMVGAAFLCWPRWFTYISFTEKGYELKTGFKKKRLIPYHQYSIYLAHYSHFGRKIEFIVFSKQKLSSVDLSNVNALKNTDELIKIKMTNKNLLALKNHLPSAVMFRLDKILKSRK
ncbi:MAG: hypothetical protein E7637_00850 [Ruminococcaceae bacterium]|nr:hypothetical protein [Oscillospiraceae bacterium]